MHILIHTTSQRHLCFTKHMVSTFSKYFASCIRYLECQLDGDKFMTLLIILMLPIWKHEKQIYCGLGERLKLDEINWEIEIVFIFLYHRINDILHSVKWQVGNATTARNI